jgi:hypothetical protein
MLIQANRRTNSCRTLCRSLSIAISFMFILSACSDLSMLSSGNELLDRMKLHKDDLNTLLAMANEDRHVVRIAPDFTRLEDDWSWPRAKIGFSVDRWNTYRELFAKAGIAEGIERERDMVFFFVSAVGLGNGHGTTKGYGYLPTTDSFIKLDSLDNGNVKAASDKNPNMYENTLIRTVDGNWYLFRD